MTAQQSNQQDTMKTTHEVSEEHAHKFATWIAERGGVLSWPSADLGNPGHSVSTPALTTEGKPYPRPGWQFTAPDTHVTELSQISVYVPKVVSTFRVKLKQSQGKLVLNNASDRKVKAALDKAGNGSFYRFQASGTSQGNMVHGLMFGEDVIEICVDGDRMPLDQWLAAHPETAAIAKATE